jgi:renal tumor antigen
MTDGFYDYKMDIWGVGCVMFEITTLYPLFPGNNELDQVHRIHNILGTPNTKVLERFRRHATHMEINFPAKVYINIAIFNEVKKSGTGLDQLLQHATKDCADLIK